MKNHHRIESAEIALTEKTGFRETERAGVFYLYADERNEVIGTALQPGRMIPSILRAHIDRAKGFVWC